MARGNLSCTPVTTVVRSPVHDDGCMRMSVADILTNMAPVIRYIVTLSPLVPLSLKGGIPGNPSLNLSYSCPPDGYNGYDGAFGSYCEVTPDSQFWGIFADVATKRLKAIRVILSNSFPDVDSPQDDEPPFGTVLFDRELIWMVPLTVTNSLFSEALIDEQPACPTLPTISSLNTRLQCTSFGFFRARELGTTQIPGNWYQDDAKQLLQESHRHRAPTWAVSKSFTLMQVASSCIH